LIRYFFILRFAGYEGNGADIPIPNFRIVGAVYPIDAGLALSCEKGAELEALRGLRGSERGSTRVPEDCPSISQFLGRIDEGNHGYGSAALDRGMSDPLG